MNIIIKILKILSPIFVGWVFTRMLSGENLRVISELVHAGTILSYVFILIYHGLVFVEISFNFNSYKQRTPFLDHRFTKAKNLIFLGLLFFILSLIIGVLWIYLLAQGNVFSIFLLDILKGFVNLLSVLYSFMVLRLLICQTRKRASDTCDVPLLGSILIELGVDSALVERALKMQEEHLKKKVEETLNV